MEKVLKLTLTNNLEKTEFVSSGTSATIGRSVKCDFVYPSPELSRQHCLVEVHENNFYITDLASVNGLTINGVRVPLNKRMPFKPDARVLLAKNYYLDVELVAAEKTQAKVLNLSILREPNKVITEAATFNLQLEMSETKAEKKKKLALHKKTKEDRPEVKQAGMLNLKQASLMALALIGAVSWVLSEFVFK